MKKAQVTIFVIIGLILVILVTILSSKKVDVLQDSEDIKTFSSETENIKTYVNDCLEYTVKDFREQLFVINEPSMVSKYVDKHLLECIDDFSGFDNLDITFDNPVSNADFSSNNLFIEVDFPIIIVRKNHRAELDIFQYRQTNYPKNEVPAGYEMIFRNGVFKPEERLGPRPIRFYVVKVDLDDPDIEFMVTPLQTGTQSTLSFLEQHGLQVAINGGGWNRDNKPELPPYYSTSDAIGWIYSQGNLVSEGENFGVTVSITKDNIPYLNEEPPEKYNVITGFSIIVDKGQVPERWTNPNHERYDPVYENNFRPRTSVGYDEENNMLIFIIVDGDGNGGSVGVSPKELGFLQVEYGAETAINMDGGSSTTLAIQGMGVVNQGGNPPVATHLGVWGEAWTLETPDLEDNVDTNLNDGTDNTGGSDIQTGSSIIDNFRIVDAGIAAGAQPSEAGFRDLANQGYKTIIDVSGAEVSWEQDVVEGLGMNYRFEPLGIYGSASELNNPANRVADMLADPSNHPVYVHCLHGAHRAGVSVGLYRVRYAGWSFENAKAEMLQYAYGNYPYDFHFEVVEMNS